MQPEITDKVTTQDLDEVRLGLTAFNSNILILMRSDRSACLFVMIRAESWPD